MRKYLKIFTILISGLLTTTVKAEPIKIGPAELSFNAGYMSNYLWRGMTQNNNDGSAYFGADMSLPYNIYIGTWTAAVDYQGSNQEVDIYAGIAPSFGSISLDLGYISYIYPGDNESSSVASAGFGEFYSSIEFAPEGMPYSLGISYSQDDTTENETTVFSASYDLGVFNVSAEKGDYEKSNEWWSVSIDKEIKGMGFTLSYTDNEMDTSNSDLDKETLYFTVSKDF